jgi:hypothetical protein
VNNVAAMGDETVSYLTLRLKVKPDGYAWLNETASEVNQVFNWANEVSFSRQLIDRHQLIVIGEVSSLKLVKTRMGGNEPLPSAARKRALTVAA